MVTNFSRVKSTGKKLSDDVPKLNSFSLSLWLAAKLGKMCLLGRATSKLQLLNLKNHTRPKKYENMNFETLFDDFGVA